MNYCVICGQYRKPMTSLGILLICDQYQYEIIGVLTNFLTRMHEDGAGAHNDRLRTS